MAEKLTYCWKKPYSQLLYFRRRIPDDVQRLRAGLGSPDAGKKWIVVSLKTSDPKSAAIRIARLVRQTDEEWRELRARATPTTSQERRSPAAYESPHTAPMSNESAFGALETLIHQMQQVLQSVRGNSKANGSLPASQFHSMYGAALSPSPHRQAFTLTDCLEEYVSARPATEDHARIAFAYLRAFLGTDRDIRKVRRKDVNGFVAHLLAGGHNAEGGRIRTSTVTRYLNVLKAAFGRAIRENEFDQTNVFARVEIPNSGKDIQRRMPYTIEQLRALHEAVDEWVGTRGWDQLRCIVIVLAETGARLAEVVGLAAADIHLSTPIPYIGLTPHPWRSLKTYGSARKIPLTPRAMIALAAAERLRNGSSFAFPRYATEVGCATDTVSSGLTAWVRSRAGLTDTKLGNHNLRHTIKDLLRAVGCPTPVQDQLLGHKTPGMGANYGQGYPLETVSEWLIKATKAATEAPMPNSP